MLELIRNILNIILLLKKLERFSILHIPINYRM